MIVTYNLKTRNYICMQDTKSYGLLRIGANDLSDRNLMSDKAICGTRMGQRRAN